MSASSSRVPRGLLGLGLPALWGWLILALVTTIPGPAQAQDSTATSAEEDARVRIDDEDADSDSPRVRLNVDVGGSDEDDDRGFTVRIDGNRSNTDYVRFGENITIEADEVIYGDVVAIGGNVTVFGRVDGDCVAVGGDIDLRAGSRVEGEVVSVGGTLVLGDSVFVGSDAVSVWGVMDAAESAQVFGEKIQVGGVTFDFPSGIFNFGGNQGFGRDIWRLFTRIVWALILVGLGILAFNLFPTRMERLADVVHHRGVVAFLAGLAGWVLWLPVFILLMVTIVGIPVALLLLFFSPVMALLGYFAVAMVAGGRLGPRIFGSGRGVARAMLAGILALEGALILARVFGLIGSVFDVFGLILALIGHSVIFIAATTGFGAFLMTRFRPSEGPPEPAAATAGVPPGSRPDSLTSPGSGLR